MRSKEAASAAGTGVTGVAQAPVGPEAAFQEPMVLEGKQDDT